MRSSAPAALPRGSYTKLALAIATALSGGVTIHAARAASADASSDTLS